MGEFLQTVRGRATVDVWLQGRSILADDLFVFQSAAQVDSVFGHRTWTLRLQAVTPAAYEQVIVPLLLSSARALQVRWGVDTGNQVSWLPLETFRVLTATPDLHTASTTTRGCPFELVLGDVFTSMDLDQRVVGHTGRISELVETLARRYDLEPRVEPTGDSPVNLVQSYETDLQFLQGRLLPAAFNRNGLTSYYCYADQGTLHFHTREWQQAAWVVPYNLGAGATLLMATDDAQTAARRGGQNQKVVAYDPLTGLTTVLTADPQRYTRFAPRLSAASATRLAGVHVGPNQLAWIAAQNQALYGAQRDRFERITFSAPNVLALRAGLILALQLPDGQAAANGYYHVEKTELSITGGVAQTVVTAARGEVAGRVAERAVRAGGGGQPLPPTSSAPGVDPSFQNAAAAPAPGLNLQPVRPGGGS